MLSGLRRPVATAGRRCLRDAGVRSGAIQSDPARASEAELQRLRTHCAGACAEPSDRSRPGRTGAAGSCSGIEICAPSSSVSTIGDLRARRSGAGSFDAGRLGRWSEPSTCPVGGGDTAVCIGSAKLHGDDIPVPVLAPGNGKTKTGRLWTYVRDDRPAGDTAAPAVWFAYSPDRKGEHPQQHLSGFTGTLQADGYAGFQRLYEGGQIQEAACWAHVRRKFFDLDQAHASPIASEALSRIGQMYGIESEIRGRSPDERLQIRQARTRPLLDQMHRWLQATSAKLSRKSAVAVAIHYALSRWAALLRFL